MPPPSKKLRICSTAACMETKPDSWLLCLPNEILLSIFNMLSAIDLLSIEHLGLERLTKISQSVEKACFETCRTIPAGTVTTFFSQDRAKFIKEINFNYFFSETYITLERAILKCKHLQKLSVIGCGLSFNSIIRIFLKLRDITEFSYNIQGNELISRKSVEMLNCYSPLKTGLSRIRKLHIHLTGNLAFFSEFLSMCSSCQELNLSLSLNPNLYSSFFYSLCNTAKFLMLEGIVLNIRNLELIMSMSDIFEEVHLWKEELFRIKDDKVDHKYIKLWLPVDDFADVNSMKWLPLNGLSALRCLVLHNEEVDLLSQMPDTTIEAVGIISKARLSDISENLQRVGGRKLKHLMLRSAFSGQKTEPEPIPNFKDLFITCCNITVLDLASAHFSKTNVASPCEAIKFLRNLRRLSLPSCVFQQFSSDQKLNKEVPFKEMVENCTLVEHFSLLNCCYCDAQNKQNSSDVRPSNKDVLWLQKWFKLKHLVIKSLQGLGPCTFLQPVAENCTELSSLQMINVGNLCQFMPLVKCFLRNAKSLMFIKISHPKLYLNDEQFWRDIGTAGKLEGICLSTGLPSCYVSSMILKNISKLQYLNLFHLHAGSLDSSLEKNVKKCMKANGVKNSRIHIVDRDSERYSSAEKILCCELHFSISSPNDYY